MAAELFEFKVIGVPQRRRDCRVPEDLRREVQIPPVSLEGHAEGVPERVGGVRGNRHQFCRDPSG